MYKHIAKILLFLAIIVCSSINAFAADDNGSFVLVIDPGHGWRDEGAPGKSSHESDIVFEIAKRFEKLVNEEYPEVKVILTHHNDKYLKLWQRGKVANDANADLSISLHTNSVDRKNRQRTKLTGAEVYTLGLEKTEASLSVTQRENAVLEVEDDSTEVYQDYDPDSLESQIIFEMYQNLNHHRSVELAENIQKELISTAGRADRGVRQANLGVLRSISMPGVLVELDFICNPTVEKLLNSTDGQNMFAQALANGFSKYYERHRNHEKQPGHVVDKIEKGAVTYSIQILASETKLKPNAHQIKQMNDVSYYVHDNLYKYIYGSYQTFEEAKEQLPKIRKNYPEAFIIKMRNGKRIM